VEIFAEVEMLEPTQGGRSSPCAYVGYRPHLVVTSGVLLGVEFTAVPAVVAPSKQLAVRLRLPYSIDYSALSVGAAFKIVEGGTHVVGHGRVTAL
jgi:hypothetical protein